MRNSYFSRKGNQIAIIIGSTFILLACLAYFDYLYTFDVLPDKEIIMEYKTVNCFLIRKKLSVKGHFFRNYRADFLITYNVNGVQYNRWVSGNGLDTKFSKNAMAQEDILAQFEVGHSYQGYYNPNNPQFAALVLRHDWVSAFTLMIPSVIISVTFYYFLKNLFKLLGFSTLRKLKMRPHNET